MEAAAFIAIQSVAGVIGQHPFQDRDSLVLQKRARLFGTNGSSNKESLNRQKAHEHQVLEHAHVRSSLDALPSDSSPSHCSKVLKSIMDTLVVSADTQQDMDLDQAYKVVRDAVFERCRLCPSKGLVQQAVAWAKRVYDLHLETPRVTFVKRALCQKRQQWFLCGSAHLIGHEVAVIIKTRLNNLQHGLAHNEEVMLQALMYLLDLPRAALLEVHEHQGMGLLLAERCTSSWARISVELAAFATEVESPSN